MNLIPEVTILTWAGLQNQSFVFSAETLSSSAFLSLFKSIDLYLSECLSFLPIKINI